MKDYVLAMLLLERIYTAIDGINGAILPVVLRALEDRQGSERKVCEGSCG